MRKSCHPAQMPACDQRSPLRDSPRGNGWHELCLSNVRKFYGINGNLSSSDGDMDFAAEEVRRRFRRVEANDLQEVEQCLDDLVPVLASTPK